jgi:large subunit ribosomal protein L30
MKLQVKLVRSTIKRVEKQKRIVAALGLRKMNQVKIHDDNPVIRGMIYKVRHLVEVIEVADVETKLVAKAKKISEPVTTQVVEVTETKETTEPVEEPTHAKRSRKKAEVDDTSDNPTEETTEDKE